MTTRDVTCPKCGRLADFLGYLNEVDVGIGVITSDPEYGCPDHGEFAFIHDYDAHETRAVFREDS